jgi:hypothetical protein
MACGSPGSDGEAYCQDCGSPVLVQRHGHFWEIFWAAAALVLIIVLASIK